MLSREKAPILHCPTCYSTTFKTSRVRAKERMQRLFGRLPVRCKSCNKRIFAGRSFSRWLRRQEESAKDLGTQTMTAVSASNASE